MRVHRATAIHVQTGAPVILARPHNSLVDGQKPDTAFASDRGNLFQ